MSLFSTRGNDSTLVVKILSNRYSRVQPVDIPAVVDLPQVVQIPECEGIKVLDLGISFERQGENISDRIERRIGLGLERDGLGFVKALPLFVIVHLEQLRAVLLKDG
jgi:hypothetical protein